MSLIVAASILAFGHLQESPGVLGYYRTPAIHGDTVVFTSEGDLWRVGVGGGLAQRLTTHPATESLPAISPDGKWVAFSASYEGPTEVYIMPIDGGLPTRLTFEGGNAQVSGWTPDGKVIYATSKYSTLPNSQLCTVDPRSHAQKLLPLAQANQGSFSGDGKELFFTRLAFQGSQTKRYQGGTAQNLWRWDGGDTEAKPLTADFKGTSRNPMWWNGRVYFASDRDGVMNIWSMDSDGKNLKEHTHHTDYDVLTPNLDAGRIVYQHGADLWVCDLNKGTDTEMSVRIASDFDQMREKWVKTPLTWTTSAHLSPDGTKVALTARGQVFVAPVKPGRLIEATRRKSVRYREARFSADSKSLVTFSDESGEVELWKLGILGAEDATKPEQLTNDGKILRLTQLPSPDGKWVAHTDKSHSFYLYDTATKTNKLIEASNVDDIGAMAWSPDSHYLAYVDAAKNTFTQIRLYTVADGKIADVTSDRFNSDSPSFSPDGKWLYFLSDRHLQTSVGSPWGTRQPEPFFDKKDQVYFVSLQPGLRSPFQPDDELNQGPEQPRRRPGAGAATAEEPKPASIPAIDTNGIEARLFLAPIPPGNYRDLTVCGSRLFMISAPGREDGPPSLVSVAITNQDVKVTPVLAGVGNFEATPDGRKILARAAGGLQVFDANGMPPDPATSRVNVDGWTFSFDPKEEWRQMFDEAWRLHRDYLYAPNMQGVNWPTMRAKYRPLVDRVTDRSELSDLLAQMVGEVSLLHTFVSGGDRRAGTDTVDVATLGAAWERSEGMGGYRITRLYKTDPDNPEDTGPLQKPGVDLKEGDVISDIDGVNALSVEDARALLRAKSGRQMRLRVFPGGDKAKARDVIVTGLNAGQDADLRYNDWEYTRRQAVENQSKGEIGYVHLRAMGGGDYDQWERDFYPVFDRQGLIIDVRHNNGGNIDSWVLEKLIRKAWMFFNQHTGQSNWNMQFAFRGQIVVLCDENTASDGEAFSEGFKRLALGKVIGTRTWGGEVWLTSSNTLVDRGVATAAEFGVYGPEGKWLVEGHGVDPDIIVDNLPHATFKGGDAQLDFAIRYLLDEIAKHPNPPTAVPPYPDKSFPPKKGGG